ncbi:MAG: hypothetical protein K2V38_02640, partial [Gemmataceae bacterium]|nr:hypothetical protein [Gemmataceae bacterium]
MAVSAEVATLFLEELARRGVPVKLGKEGGYEVQVGDLTATIQLENLSRDFARDRDPARVADFVDTILAKLEIPSWEAAKPRLRWSLEPTDAPVEDALHDKLSDQVALVLVHVSADESQVMWVAEHMARKWGQTKESIFAAAVDNMRQLGRNQDHHHARGRAHARHGGDAVHRVQGGAGAVPRAEGTGRAGARVAAVRRDADARLRLPDPRKGP